MKSKEVASLASLAANDRHRQGAAATRDPRSGRGSRQASHQ